MEPQRSGLGLLDILNSLDSEPSAAAPPPSFPEHEPTGQGLGLLGILDSLDRERDERIAELEAQQAAAEQGLSATGEPVDMAGAPATFAEGLGSVGRAALTGAADLVGGLGSAVGAVIPDALGWTPPAMAAEGLQAVQRYYQEEREPEIARQQEIAEQHPLSAGLAQDVAAQIPQLAVMGAAATPARALGLIGASAAGSGIQEAEAAGATPGQALAHGAVSGAVEAATERFGTLPVLQKLLKKNALKASGEFTKTGLQRVVRDVGRNFGEEVAASVGQRLSALGTYDEKGRFTYEDVEQAAREGMIGGIVGGAASVMAEGVNKRRARMDQEAAAQQAEADRIKAAAQANEVRTQQEVVLPPEPEAAVQAPPAEEAVTPPLQPEPPRAEAPAQAAPEVPQEPQTREVAREDQEAETEAAVRTAPEGAEAEGVLEPERAEAAQATESAASAPAQLYREASEKELLRYLSGRTEKDTSTVFLSADKRAPTGSRKIPGMRVAFDQETLKAIPAGEAGKTRQWAAAKKSPLTFGQALSEVEIPKPPTVLKGTFAKAEEMLEAKVAQGTWTKEETNSAIIYRRAPPPVVEIPAEPKKRTIYDIKRERKQRGETRLQNYRTNPELQEKRRRQLLLNRKDALGRTARYFAGVGEFKEYYDQLEADAILAEQELAEERAAIQAEQGDTEFDPAQLGVTPGAATVEGMLSDKVSLPSLKRTFRKYFFSRGLAPSEQAREVVEERYGAMSEASRNAEDWAVEIDRLTSGWAKATKKPLAEAEAAVNSFLDGESDGKQLPVAIRNRAAAMRQELDRLSKAAMETEGMLPEALRETFGANLGKYLTRTYAVHRERKGWFGKTPQERYIGRLKSSGQWDTLRSDIASLEEFEGKSEAEVDTFMRLMIEENAGAERSKTGPGLGTQEVGIYRRRQDIPDPIRKLLGEDTKPGVRYYETVKKLTRNLATFQMYSAIRDMGLREGWLKEKPEGEAVRRLEGGRQPRKGQEALATEKSPVGGLFAEQDIADWIEGPMETIEAGVLTRLTGLIKEAKTVGSIQAQSRNFLSNFLIIGGGGNSPLFAPWRKGQENLGLRKASRQLRERGGGAVETLGNVVGLTVDQARTRWSKWAKLAVVESNPDLADIDAMLNTKNPLEVSDPRGRFLSKLRHGARGWYRWGDEVFKVATAESELAKIRWYDPQRSLAEAEREAASITKDIVPTDIRSPRVVKAIRRVPIFGTFTAFYSEIPRIGKNIVMRGVHEIREGNKRGNKRMVQVGVHRLVSLATTLGVPTMFAAALAGYREDEKPDEQLAVRELLPFFSENSQIAVLGVKNGKVTVFDQSFMDPWGSLKRPLIAMLSKGPLDEREIQTRFREAVTEFLDPYISESLGVSMAISLSRNLDEQGRQIYDPDAPPDEIREKILAFIAKGVAPGTAITAQRIANAMTGRSASGVGTEALAVFGPRLMTISIEDKVRYAGLDYLDSKRRATSRYDQTAKRRTKITESDLRDAERAAKAISDAGIQRLSRKIWAARKLGLSDEQITAALKKARVGKKDLAVALTGADAMKALRYEQLEDMMGERKELRAEEGWQTDQD